MSSFVTKLTKMFQKSVVAKKFPAIFLNENKFWFNQILKRYFDFSESREEECFLCKLKILKSSDIESYIIFSLCNVCNISKSLYILSQNFKKHLFFLPLVQLS